jgi:N-sulfoglucosamine sulfohydrolase
MGFRTFAALFTLVLGPAAAAGKPHIVVFLSDDHGQLDSTPYGATDVRTPQMQKLADAGCRFTHAFIASPACAPSRAALLTGLMPARNGAESNHAFKKDMIASLPEVLRKFGYQTAAFGKVAHGPKDVARHGFDDHGRPHDAAFVADFLAKRDRSKPLCLFVGTNHPHVPWPDNAGYDPKTVKLPATFVDTPETRDYRCRYYTGVTKADTLLGQVRDLVRREVGRNALFVYTSDHGAQWPFGKWNLYDAGIRVPLLVEWPGVVKPGTTSDAMVQWTDLLPTLIDVAGGTVPADIDGKSFTGVLRNLAADHRDRIFTTHTNDGDMNVYPIRSVRTREFKYVRNLRPGWEHTTHIDRAKAVDGVYYWTSWVDAAKASPAVAALVERYHRRPAEELYDLKADPFEMNNLAAEQRYADTLKGLSAALDAWMKAQGDAGRVAGKPRLLSGDK